MNVVIGNHWTVFKKFKSEQMKIIIMVIISYSRTEQNATNYNFHREKQTGPMSSPTASSPCFPNHMSMSVTGSIMGLLLLNVNVPFPSE